MGNTEVKKLRLEKIFKENLATALSIGDNEASLRCGMTESVAEKYRNFSKMSESEKLEEVLKGNV